MIKKLFLLFLIVVIALAFNALKIRLCPIFNIFNIPCAGCGLTRAVKLIITGNIFESFKYSVLPFPILIIIIIYVICSFLYKDKFSSFINRNKLLIIIVSFFMMLIVWGININNELLY